MKSKVEKKNWFKIIFDMKGFADTGKVIMRLVLGYLVIINLISLIGFFQSNVLAGNFFICFAIFLVPLYLAYKGLEDSGMMEEINLSGVKNG